MLWLRYFLVTHLSTLFAAETGKLSEEVLPVKSIVGKSVSLPLTPVLSGSTCASFTFPSSTTSAYLLLRLLPKMEALSKERSKASVNLASGSPRKRIYICQLWGCKSCRRGRSGDGSMQAVAPRSWGGKGWRTPLLFEGSSVAPQAFMTNASLTDTTKTLPADLREGLLRYPGMWEALQLGPRDW